MLKFLYNTKNKHLNIPYFAMYNVLPHNVHPHFWPKLSGKKNFHFYFLIQFLSYFIFRNKTNYHIPGYYFAYGYHYCFLQLHFFFKKIYTYFNCHSSTVVSIFLLALSPAPPPILPPLALSMCPLYVLLDDLSPSFACYPPSPSSLVTVTLFFISMSLVTLLMHKHK